MKQYLGNVLGSVRNEFAKVVVGQFNKLGYTKKETMPLVTLDDAIQAWTSAEQVQRFALHPKDVMEDYYKCVELPKRDTECVVNWFHSFNETNSVLFRVDPNVVDASTKR